jgi:hypothetical protein
MGEQRPEWRKKMLAKVGYAIAIVVIVLLAFHAWV